MCVVEYKMFVCAYYKYLNMHVYIWIVSALFHTSSLFELCYSPLKGSVP